jgi:putative oxidoreductase
MESLRQFFRAGPVEPLPWRILRIAVALVFVYAGAAKVADPQEFTLSIDYFRLTPWPVTVGLAFYLPWFELGLGGFLLTRRLVPGASLLGFAASLVFLVAILSAWSRDLDISCGCFGPARNHTHYPSHLAFNLLLLAATGVQAGVHIFRKPPSGD